GIAAAVLEAVATVAGADGILPDAEHEPAPLQLAHLAVRSMPGSATPEEQLNAAGLSAHHIAGAVRTLVDTGD
ncbi:MAG TPA: hypothetical protein VER55_03945, partial [Ardenticatenaceae bacterium]|nr:hypothetical protein [Ardenticatenaceae bacterium]